MNQQLDELKQNFNTLANVVYSAGLNEESENLKTWLNQLFKEIGRLQQKNDELKKYVSFYRTAEFTLSDQQMHRLLREALLEKAE